ncbi:MAG TPA: carboxypeptidase regulatory-like domain-containing protein [Methylomirabilota bacterium]|nr:carboxypeptidase regulatory-like domain-containing protein [Methylomirabilota bacterium]
MKLNRLLFTAALLAAAVPAIHAGDVKGKITLNGDAPAERDITIGANDPCGKLHPNKKTRFYVVGADKGLADVFIYVKDDQSGKKFEVPAKPLLLDQVGCEYVPYIAGVQTGQKILVRNSDPVMHNVHPTPDKKTGNPEKNLAQMPKAKDLEFTYANPEMFLRFKCDVHPWMFSYVSVMNHPYFAVSDKDGNFTIANLPAGEYTIEANHRKGGVQTQKVKVDASGAATVNFAFDPK